MTENEQAAVGTSDPVTPGAHEGRGQRRPWLEPADYSARIAYRRPSTWYVRLQWIGFLLTRLGLSPRYVVTLEVPGRRSGQIHRTSLVQTTLDGAHYLVALGGESE